MESTPKLWFFIIIGSLFVFFLIDVSYQMFLSDDVKKSLENSIKGGVQQSINKGTLRVEEVMTIDSERFIEFQQSLYTNNQSVRNAEERTYFHATSEFPPMVTLHSAGASESSFKKAFDEDPIVTTNKKEIAIMEKIK
ncbi:DUF5411 family protein [Cytobacillus sp. IB215665]|uniref:DUF5411 family protein n=1 Tax=Cytobacillus sp. IB215665 TaxID=3097357 RepID=UPI002A1298BE|nr:DUF5411 family protein [Cytobacillus sp. IB215665]MDX8367192.1 DUF5411 family protein [Cytobacillus sp. IB215665]